MEAYPVLERLLRLASPVSMLIFILAKTVSEHPANKLDFLFHVGSCVDVAFHKGDT